MTWWDPDVVWRHQELVEGHGNDNAANFLKLICSSPCWDMGSEERKLMNKQIDRRMFMHPHPDKRHVMRQVRRYLLAAKRQFGTARSLVHYKDLIQTYLVAKQEVLDGASNA